MYRTKKKKVVRRTATSAIALVAAVAIGTAVTGISGAAPQSHPVYATSDK
jgi:hypothetical protein